MKTGRIYFGSVVVLLFAILIYISGRGSADLEKGSQYEYEVPSWSNWIEYGMLPCQKPMVLRNAFNVTDPETQPNCKEDSNDYCASFIKQKFIRLFGKRTVEVYGPDLRITEQKVGQYQGFTFVNTKEFLTSDEYLGYTVHALHQLGNVSEYDAFLQNNFTNFIAQPHNTYLGSQFFMARAPLSTRSGSSMHFAWAKNVFIMLGGKKRWLMVHPNYSYILGCKMGGGGLYGYCNGHNATKGDVNIDEQVYPLLEMYNISNEYNPDSYMDVILEPGDVLLLCPVWLHTIENLTPETYAHALRFKEGSIWKSLRGIKRRIIFDSIISAIVSKFNDWNRITMFDIIYNTKYGVRKDILNFDKRMKHSGAVNQKQR
eukprot:464600_1